MFSEGDDMQKDMIIAQLRENGFRITKQRELLIDIILEGNYSCCKEVYVLAHKKDPGIGSATIYRTVAALEQIGALERKAAFQLCRQKREARKCCLIELEDNTTVELDYDSMEKIIEKGLKDCGYSSGKRIKNISWGSTPV